MTPREARAEIARVLSDTARALLSDGTPLDAVMIVGLYELADDDRPQAECAVAGLGASHVSALAGELRRLAGEIEKRMPKGEPS